MQHSSSVASQIEQRSKFSTATILKIDSQKKVRTKSLKQVNFTARKISRQPRLAIPLESKALVIAAKFQSRRCATFSATLA
jgi:hypothetical protein